MLFRTLFIGAFMVGFGSLVIAGMYDQMPAAFPYVFIFMGIGFFVGRSIYNEIGAE